MDVRVQHQLEVGFDYAARRLPVHPEASMSASVQPFESFGIVCLMTSCSDSEHVARAVDGTTLHRSHRQTPLLTRPLRLRTQKNPSVRGSNSLETTTVNVAVLRRKVH